MATENKIIVIVDNTSVMNSIESANIKLTSPSGKTIYLKKSSLHKRATEEMRKVFWLCANDPMTPYVGPVSLTIEEMRLAYQMSKL